MSTAGTLGWVGIVRLGLVQTALGSIVVLVTSTLNRVMIVELALAAVLPGALVALHYAVQVTRPRLGYGSDVGGRRTPWIVGGMAVLALGGFGAACATVLMEQSLVLGIGAAVVAFVLVGLGVGASGTSLLVLLAKQVAPERRPAAATIVWTMMIVGFVITASVAGHFLDPFSFARMLGVTATVSGIALVVTVLAVYGIEDGRGMSMSTGGLAARDADAPPFFQALKHVLAEPTARRFAVFVFVSMLAYSAQDLILEPYAGAVFGFTPGESTQLAGVQHGGVLVGMLLVALIGGGRRSDRRLRQFTIGGCIGSATALVVLGAGGQYPDSFPLAPCVFALGFSNGVFAVAAIGSMMTLVGEGRANREGVRMGLWGAAQAIAFGAGGFLGAASVDLMRQLVVDDTALAFGVVFGAEGVLFVLAAMLAIRAVGHYAAPPAASGPHPSGITVVTATAEAFRQ